MAAGRARIANSAGIHVRPSGVIFSALKDYPGDISVESAGMTTDLKGVVGLIALGLQKGDVVDVSVSGPDEDEVCSRLIKLLETEFDFPPKS